MRATCNVPQCKFWWELWWIMMNHDESWWIMMNYAHGTDGTVSLVILVTLAVAQEWLAFAGALAKVRKVAMLDKFPQTLSRWQSSVYTTIIHHQILNHTLWSFMSFCEWQCMTMPHTSEVPSRLKIWGPALVIFACVAAAVGISDCFPDTRIKRYQEPLMFLCCH